ncbi:MAG TPA: hypothetical protein VMO20_09080 [Candidatus Acidoferrum sp.]|nr:hypothetical protein [Candidatus Acidoferrum sp.]
MLELIFPLDFERLAEFRLLCEAMRKAGSGDTCVRDATFIYSRLFVELGYLAQVTNQPGYLTSDGVALFESSLGQPVTKVLADCRVLVPAPGGEFFCERFARHNAHLSGDFKSGQNRGAANSAVVRAQKQLVKESLQQAMLLPPEFYKKQDGSTMSDTESRQAILLIKNLDRCLKLPTRLTRQFTEGLVMDAGMAAAKYSEEQLMQFYFWLRNNRENPVVPKTTEKILAEFDKFFEVSRMSPSPEIKEQNITAT